MILKTKSIQMYAIYDIIQQNLEHSAGRTKVADNYSSMSGSDTNELANSNIAVRLGKLSKNYNT